MNLIDGGLLWTAAVGQAAFVIVWATQKWWSTRVGRALMWKSASLALILAATLYAYYRGPLPLWVGRGMFALVTAGILGQLVAISLEIRKAPKKKKRRRKKKD